MVATAKDLPTPGNLWDRPKTADKGNATPDEIYLAVGMALTVWESVETTFALILSAFMDTKPPNSAARVYGSIISPGGRRDALNAASELFFHWNKASSDHKDEYKLLMTHFQRAIGRRNDVAHGMVFNIQKLGHFLRPAPYNSSKNSDFFVYVEEQKIKNSYELNLLDMSEYAYTARDITKIANSFLQLREVAGNYLVALNQYHPAHPAPSRQSAPQEPKQTDGS